ncbi:MAG TPA: DNA polymerase III subunit gamma/tau [Candidatus Cloacimonadota bacterium]|nr:DNA polymerase III subunit gamma/tau [Candidatus Cloacimonadota bacterium]
MSYIVLARKYRPQTFSEVYAQDHVTEILQNAIESKRIAHAFLFTGPRGVGKTSMARILAKSLNCEEGPSAHPCNKCHNCLEITAGTSSDVIEIDGASNTGVDDIRELQKELMYAPSQSQYKIYIIDEVHMLSKNAFNALLKTLEEPPENVLFIFATTEAQKVLATIVSRCQRYDFKRIPVEAIVKRLREITASENIQIDDESLYMIARKADGGMRDALSLMDQVLSYCLNDVSGEKVREIFGMIPNQVFSNIFSMVKRRDSANLIASLHQVLEDGMDPQELLINMTEFIRVTLLRKTGVTPQDIVADEYPLFDAVADEFTPTELLYLISTLMQTRTDIKGSSNPQLVLEVLMLKLSRMQEMNEISELIKLVRSGNLLPAARPTSGAADPAPATSPAPRDAKPAPQYSPGSTPVTHHEAPMEKISFDLDSVQAHREKIDVRIKRISNITSLAFAAAQIDRAEGDILSLSVSSASHYNALISKKEEIERQLSDLFGHPIHLKVTQIKSAEAPKIEIKRRNINEVKEKDPLLARYIEVTDSKLGAGY